MRSSDISVSKGGNSTMTMNKRTFTIFIIMVTEFLGFALILPFLSVYAQSMGMNELTVGIFLSVFPFFQFFAAPILGKISDQVGRKPMLILSQIMTGIGFVLLAVARVPWVLFLARFIDGALGANFTIAQAYLSDISSEDDRTTAMGIAGGAMGIGGLIGPAVGGYLSRFGYCRNRAPDAYGKSGQKSPVYVYGVGLGPWNLLRPGNKTR